ncbi:MAG: hypothetical protein D4R73_01500 [Deltaproteobacteria bacterium]|nr:MAG: hypothetical protein D4R73_01500 [Deltaproteobacteria bacterium]
MIYVIHFSVNGVPQAGLAPAIITYKTVAAGEDLPPVPEIAAIGGGGYKFSAIAVEAIYVEIDGGAGLDNEDRYKVLQITPEDNNLDVPVSSRSSLGIGAITWTYTLTRSDNGLPIADAQVWISTDAAGQNIIASGRTDQNGGVTFYLDAGTVYIWRQKAGVTFINPDTEVVS